MNSNTNQISRVGIFTTEFSQGHLLAFLYVAVKICKQCLHSSEDVALHFCSMQTETSSTDRKRPVLLR